VITVTAEQMVEALVKEIDRERSRLRRLVIAQPAATLTRRRRADEWSIIENVRHLLFAEQAHLGSFLPERFEWSPVGLTNRTARQFAVVGTKPARDIAVVFAEWDSVHKPIRAAVRRAGGDVEKALRGNLRHLCIHIAVIEKLLRATARGRSDAALSGAAGRSR
jgi:hypothetical protein